MANPTGFSVPPSEVVSVSDISAMDHSSSSAQSSILSMEEKKLKSLTGQAVAVTSVKSGSSNVPRVAESSEKSGTSTRPVTEQNVQLHSANYKTVGTTSHGGSVVSSAEKAKRYEMARAVYEAAQARIMMLQAADDLTAGSQTGSVGRRLDDVRSDTGSSGPSPPIAAQESPFAGVFSMPLSTTPTTTITPTPTIYYIFFGRTWSAYHR
jgi:hypothetical protein